MFWIIGTTPERRHDGKKRVSRAEPRGADVVGMELALGVVGVVWRRCDGGGPGCADPKPSTTHKAGASRRSRRRARPLAPSGSISWSAPSTGIARSVPTIGAIPTSIGWKVVRPAQQRPPSRAIRRVDWLSHQSQGTSTLTGLCRRCC